jgi:hypothetical protein
VPDFPGLFVRALTVNEGQRLFDQVGAGADDDQAAKLMISAAACDQDGGPLFSGPEDPEFGETSKDVLRALWDEAGRVNRITDPKAAG